MDHPPSILQKCSFSLSFCLHFHIPFLSCFQTMSPFPCPLMLVLENKTTSAFLWCITMATHFPHCHHLCSIYLEIPELVTYLLVYPHTFYISLPYPLPQYSLSTPSLAFLTSLHVHCCLYLYIAPLFLHLNCLPVQHWGIVSFLDLVASYTHYVYSHCCYSYRLWALH